MGNTRPSARPLQQPLHRRHYRRPVRAPSLPLPPPKPLKVSPAHIMGGRHFIYLVDAQARGCALVGATGGINPRRSSQGAVEQTL